MTQTIKDTCLSDLKHRILAMDLEPGAPLDEVRLAEHYNVSRTPMREVLQRLAGASYATLQDNRGAKVASMDVARLRTFFQTAPMIYGNMARLAAENRTEAQLEELQGAQDEFEAALRAADVNATALANHRFHEIIGQMADNPYLMASLTRLLIDHTRLSLTFYSPVSPIEEALVAAAFEQHREMIEALRERDALRTSDLTLRHWDLSKDRLERFVTPAPLPGDLAGLRRRRHEV